MPEEPTADTPFKVVPCANALENASSQPAGFHGQRPARESARL